MRQPITLYAQSIECLLYQLGENLEDVKLIGTYRDLIKNLEYYHNICLDKNSYWLQHYQKSLSALKNVNRFEYGELVRKWLDTSLTKILKMYCVGIEVKSNDIEKLCIEIAEKSSSKILVCHKKLKNERLKNYTIEEFNERNDKEMSLLRKEKVCKFNKGEKIKGFAFLEPYIMYANELRIFDQYLFKCAEDWRIVDLLCRSISNLEKLILGTQFDKHDRNVMKNIEQLKNNFPNTSIETTNYNQHEREIVSEYSKIVLTASINNFTLDNRNDWITKRAMTFSATLNP